ncbi:hypothetical protein [Aquipseudomonas alcaligenes]|uniref:Short-chain dehydrogenase n=1 Tax=Aquipseudomonas alcaligenes (strain ATCC 14909 / DSM 50342 / CCUG 1425 / JCM 20561 / NBRC 14159 / NCIMB 9945 / NCTC 10367 / 1577) TaxID=1215092 RepID=U3B6V9_AQUA1|nr:hypothetical protein [Pseudomonas alcaligenes]GAD62633.1 hypothetical protein PA6_014_00050 [Pseudomonas alcaligenes NBRC 14159]SUD18161.1 Uncharacterised protein [Pseudomonas alcaligenes]
MDQSTDQRTTLLADSPESALILNPATDPQSIDDIMLCALQRNAAVIDVLAQDILDRDQFALPISTIRNLLWLLQGQFDQMKMIMREYRKHR